MTNPSRSGLTPDHLARLEQAREQIVSRLGGVSPTEEDVGGRLQQPLTLDDTATMVFVGG